MQIVDYSVARPDPATIRANFIGVGRYLAPLPNPKVLTASERDALLDAGLEICVVWETIANRAAAGAIAGRGDVQAAEAQADVLGIPSNACIYYSVDFDATPAQITPYFQGINELHRRPVGGYGSYTVVESLFDQGLISYAWQTSAWSRKQRSLRACLYQRADASPLPNTDVDDVLMADWGQWPRPAPPAPKAEDDMTPGQCRDKQGRKWHFYLDDQGGCSSLLEGKPNNRPLGTIDPGWTSGFDAYCDPDGTIAVCGRTKAGQLAQIVFVPGGAPAILNPLGVHVYPPA